MVVNPAISNLIREGKVYQIPSAIQTGNAIGMYSMEQSLQKLRNDGIISDEVYQTRSRASFTPTLTSTGTSAATPTTNINTQQQSIGGSAYGNTPKPTSPYGSNPYSSPYGSGSNTASSSPYASSSFGTIK